MRVKRGEMDRKQLRLKLFEKDLNITSLSKAIGVNKDTFYRRLRNQGKKLTLGDLKKTIAVLELSNHGFCETRKRYDGTNNHNRYEFWNSDCVCAVGRIY